MVHFALLGDKGDVVAGHPATKEEDDAEGEGTEDVVEVETMLAESVSGEDQFHIFLLEIYPLLAPIMPMVCLLFTIIIQKEREEMATNG